MKPIISMRAALSEPELFASILPGPSWANWRIWAIAVMGEPLTDDERAIFAKLTGRDSEPVEPCEESYAVVGRRSGKTRCAAVLAAYYAALCTYDDVLAPGERATLPIMSATVWQANKALQYLNGIFTEVPALKALVVGRTNDSISLSTRVDIECTPAAFRTLRGGTACCIIADEVAFWRNEATANPDVEILNSARPMLATTGGPLIVISTPYARRGALWAAYKRDFGPEGDRLILIAKASSREMNPSLPAKVVTRAYERDAAAAAAEYGGEFRTDIESFVSREAVDAATFPDRLELPPVPDVDYVAFVDPAGGSGGSGAGDSMTLGIAHAEGDVAVLDCVRERKPPFSPDGVVAEFVEVLGRYRVSEVTGDRWGGEFVAEQFTKRGVTYRISERVKSDIYRELLPLLNSRRVELLDLPRLTAQLCSLERRTARGGKDSIDHPPGPNSHDDCINSAAGCLILASGIGSSNGFNLTVWLQAWAPQALTEGEKSQTLN